MIDRATVEKIKEAANIVDVVSEFVTLRKSGANYKGRRHVAHATALVVERVAVQ